MGPPSALSALPPRAHTRADGAEAGLTVLREAPRPPDGRRLFYLVFLFFIFF